MTWLSVPITVDGQWGEAQPADVIAVLRSARNAAVDGLTLDLARVPSRIDVIGEEEAPCPMVYALDNADHSATVRLTVKGRYWAQLSYQFSHELGHVVAGSWRADAIPASPSAWFEEALVESFAVCTLDRMAQRWVVAPPYPNWASFSSALAEYAGGVIAKYLGHPKATTFANAPSRWLDEEQENLAASLALTDHVWPAVPWIVARFREDPSLMSDISGLNRWPERCRLPIDDYLNQWQASCRDLSLPARLPAVLIDHFARR